VRIGVPWLPAVLRRSPLRLARSWHGRWLDRLLSVGTGTVRFPRSTDTSGVGSVILVWPGMEGLEGGGAVHSDAGMASFRIVPTLYPLEDSGGKFIAGLPFFRVE
jgi:hypothetical protein